MDFSLISLLEEWNASVLGIAVPVMLFLLGGFYLFYLKAFYLRHPILVLRSMLSPSGKRSTGKGYSSFRAVTLALAGTLGVGNLVGVASAIALGGAGAVFWMMLSALLAMLLKYAEIVLALRHRPSAPSERLHGGAMYYIRACLSSLRLPRLGGILASVFAILCILDSFTMGCVIQMNAVGSAFRGSIGASRTVVGSVLAVLVFLVTVGGGKRISALTERLVPLMTLIYLIISIAVLVLRREALPMALRSVWEDAFSVSAAVPGIGGFLMSKALRFGTFRGLMSNEAGCGTAPIAHAEAEVRFPAEQGLWGIFEVFADTLLLCTLTASVILVSYDRVSVFGHDGMLMTMKAYSVVLGEWSEGVMTLLVLFFAFATAICWAHYGRCAVAYLSRNVKFQYLYIICYAVTAFLGTVSAPDSIFTVADFALGLMTLINLVVLFLMRGEVRDETEIFLKNARGK